MADKSRAPTPAAPTATPSPAPIPAPDLQDLYGNQFVLQMMKNEGGDAGVPAAPAALAAAPAGPPAPKRPTAADTAWIDALDGRVREQIDGKFSEDSVRRKVNKSARRRRRRGEEVDVEAEVDAKMRDKANAGHIRKRRESTHGDTVYSDVDKRTGTQIAREDFVAVGWSLFGSTAATKAWFERITSDPGVAGGVLLHETALARLKAANAQLKRERGWEIPTCHVGFQGRSRQHNRNSVGYLAHFLGLAFDLAARANPHLKNTDQRVLAETAGADGASPGHARLKLRKPGSSDLYDYGDLRRQIAAMGQATASGKPLSAEGRRLSTTELDRGYGQMLATEKRMRSALDVNGNGAGDELDALGDTAKRYWAARREIRKLRKVRDTHRRRLAKEAPRQTRRAILKEYRAAYRDALAQRRSHLQAEADAEAKAAGKKRGRRVSNSVVAADPEIQRLRAMSRRRAKDVGPDEIDGHPTYVAYEDRLRQAQADLDGVEGPIVRAKDRLLAPWFAAHDQRASRLDAAAGTAEVADLKRLDRALSRLKRARSRRSRERVLQRFAADPELAPLIDGLASTERSDPKAVRAALTTARDQTRQQLDARDGAAAVRRSRAKLDDLDYVFGTRAAKPGRGGQWANDAVSDPSAFQLARSGLLYQGNEGSHDQHYKGPNDDQRDIYYREIIRVLMVHGFAPGAQWKSADSMHFELVEQLNGIGGGSHGAFGRQEG